MVEAWKQFSESVHKWKNYQIMLNHKYNEPSECHLDCENGTFIKSNFGSIFVDIELNMIHVYGQRVIQNAMESVYKLHLFSRLN